MSDILFRCEHCLQGLSVEDGYSGADLICPYCSQMVTVPAICSWFACASCGCSLASGDGSKGDVFGCPHCGARLEVPENITVRCISCSVYLELNDEYQAEFGGQTVDCPECSGDVLIPEMIQEEAVEPEPSDEAAAIQPAPPQDHSGEFMQKTMKLDEILEDIPQSQSISKGKCPYCAQPLRNLHDNAYLCKRCHRVIRTVKHKGRSSKGSTFSGR